MIYGGIEFHYELSADLKSWEHFS